MDLALLFLVVKRPRGRGTAKPKDAKESLFSNEDAESDEGMCDMRYRKLHDDGGRDTMTAVIR